MIRELENKLASCVDPAEYDAISAQIQEAKKAQSLATAKERAENEAKQQAEFNQAVSVFRSRQAALEEKRAKVYEGTEQTFNAMCTMYEAARETIDQRSAVCAEIKALQAEAVRLGIDPAEITNLKMAPLMPENDDLRQWLRESFERVLTQFIFMEKHASDARPPYEWMTASYGAPKP